MQAKARKRARNAAFVPESVVVVGKREGSHQTMWEESEGGMNLSRFPGWGKVYVLVDSVYKRLLLAHSESLRSDGMLSVGGKSLG